MAKQTASKTKAGRRKQAPPRGRGGASVFSFLVLGAMMVFAPAMTALLLVGMLPTLVILFADASPEKVSRLSAMFTFNASGVLPHAVFLWEEGLQMQVVIEQLGDIVTWTFMYGAAGAGALALWLGPVIVAGAQQIMNYDRVRQLDRSREALIAEWGEEITRSSAD